MENAVNTTKYYIAKARFLPNSFFYFMHTPTEDKEFPILDVVNPADYNIYEVTEEEYKAQKTRKRGI
jgi:hypothetical protein